MEKEITKTVNFKISLIKTLKFFVSNFDEPSKEERMNYPINLDFSLVIEPEHKTVAIEINITITRQPNSQEVVCGLITRTGFEVTNFEELISVSEKGIDIPRDLLYNFISLAVSASRGVLAAKTEGTCLRDVYIPVFDITRIDVNPLLQKFINNKVL